MNIVDIDPGDESQARQIAELLVDLMPEGWPTIETGLEEVRESYPDDRVSRVAMDGDAVLGWIGGLKLSYPNDVWELHPLVVRRDHHRQGIGRALVTDLEERLRKRGCKIVYLGTDDKRGETTLADVDLFPDALEHAAALRNVRGHPYEFYQKLGYTVVGVLPDANGFGRPDIFMAKRLDPSIVPRG